MIRVVFFISSPMALFYAGRRPTMLGGGVLLLTAHACRVRDGVDEPASLFGWRTR